MQEALNKDFKKIERSAVWYSRLVVLSPVGQLG